MVKGAAIKVQVDDYINYNEHITLHKLLTCSHTAEGMEIEPVKRYWPANRELTLHTHTHTQIHTPGGA